MFIDVAQESDRTQASKEQEHRVRYGRVAGIPEIPYDG
jgi:hypothetical protein